MLYLKNKIFLKSSSFEKYIINFETTIVARANGYNYSSSGKWYH